MLHQFERYPLTFGPSPIVRPEQLSAHIGRRFEVRAKRDDCDSGLARGGNKIRKLEYIVPNVLASGVETLVTIGGHPRALRASH